MRRDCCDSEGRAQLLLLAPECTVSCCPEMLEHRLDRPMRVMCSEAVEDPQVLPHGVAHLEGRDEIFGEDAREAQVFLNLEVRFRNHRVSQAVNDGSVKIPVELPQTLLKFLHPGVRLDPAQNLFVRRHGLLDPARRRKLGELLQSLAFDD